MRIAYLDCFSGISGDMFLGALVDAGVPSSLLEETVRALKVGATLDIRKVDRSGITSTKVDVIVNGERDMPREEFWREQEIKKRHEHLTGHVHEHGHDHPHTHDASTQGAVKIAAEGPSDAEHGHAHSHPHTHSHSHEHSHGDHEHAGSQGHGRTLRDIKKLIAASDIPESAKQRATAIFQALGEAEAKIHNADLENIHFHEVGSADAIVDIVCASVGANYLAIDEWVFSPLNVGGGTVRCAHGTFPVPAPATTELLKHAPVYSGEIQKELVTPTGAAIARTFASRFSTFPPMTIEKVGYGAGSRNFERHPNVLRITIGESATESGAALASHSSPGTDTIRVIEANLDDATPQVLGYVQERLLAMGALDVFCIPIQMKKNRPGTLLTVLARPENSQALIDIVFAESTTIGVRVREEHRQVLERRTTAVQTPWGEVRIKIAHRGNDVRNAAPEYEDCRRIAAEHNVPLKRVMQEALRIYADKQNG